MTDEQIKMFVGASSYYSGGTAAVIRQKSCSFPQTTYTTFDTGDTNVILEKLKEFNSATTAGDKAVDSAVLERVVLLCNGPASDENSLEQLLNLCRNWPDGT